jgi:hypothetical protein
VYIPSRIFNKIHFAVLERDHTGRQSNWQLQDTSIRRSFYT